MSGNTGYAGGTRGADPVPAHPGTAPDGSTVLGTEEPPEPTTGEQNEGYENPEDEGTDDDSDAVG